VDDLEKWIKVGGRWIKALRLADDQAMMAGRLTGLQVRTDRLKTISNE